MTGADWGVVAAVLVALAGLAIWDRYRKRVSLAPGFEPRDVRALFALRHQAAQAVLDAKAGRRVRNRVRRLNREREKVMHRVARRNGAR